MPLQLGLGLNRLGGFNPFTPNHLNPYLLFDTRTSMLGELESPTLDLDPAVPSSLDVITATRSGVATYTDINGTIQTADPNTVRVDYTQGEELTPTVYQRTRFTDFSNGWLNSGVSTVANTESFQGQVAKRFTVTGNGVYYAFTPVETGQEYTASFYARLISGSPSYLYFFNNGSDLVYTPISVTSEWQRFTTTVTSTGTSINSGIINTTGTEPVVVEISQPQFEEGTTATTFVPNTTGSPKFIASATYSPRVPMMLIEPSATNLATYSEDFSNSVYVKDSGVAIGTTNHVSPSGSTNATKIEVSDNGRLYRNFTSATYATSIFIKSGTFAHFVVAGSQIDLNAGTATSGTIEQLNDGWYRVSNIIATSRPFQVQAYPDSNYAIHTDSGDYYIWGAQVETGSVATSYIPTSGSTVTRAADNLVIDGSAFSDFYNATEGTVYAEAVPQDGINEFPYYFEFSNGTTANRHHSYRSGAVSTFYTCNIGGTTLFNTGIGPATLDSLNRISYSYKPNDYLGSANGTTPVPETGAVPTGISQLLIGNSVAPTPRLMTGRIKRLIYWPTHSDSL